MSDHLGRLSEGLPNRAKELRGYDQSRKASTMAKTEITKSPEKSVSSPRDIFSAMRDEMDRMFERFEHGWPQWPALFRRNGDLTVPDLDVRENTNSFVVEAE